jgi:methionyl-tRNA synthetase
MKARGDIYLGAYEGWYCTGCEAFYPENQIKDGRCELGHPVEKMKEESYFFRLSAYQDRLLEMYRAREAQGRPFVQPRGRMNEVRSFVQGGLNDLSISRNTVRWGVPVPGDPTHVVYVWLDALTNYISALGFGSGEEALYDRYWREAPDATVLQLIGKDILRFHAVYWPAFLLSAGLPVPMTVYSHGWWLMDEAKMSKSLGNVVRPGPLLEAVGPDPIRYFLLREMSFGSDGTYSHSALIERLNGDLANGVGNLLSRVLTLIEKETGGRIPPPGKDTPAVQALGESARAAYAAFTGAFDRYAFSEGLAAIFDFVGEVNRFLVREEPWKLAKDPARAAELRSTLRACAEAIRSIAHWSAPVMPAASREALRQLGLEPDPTPGALAAWSWDALPAGTAVARGASLFPRADRAELLARIESLSEEASAVTDTPDPKSPPPVSSAAPAPSGPAPSLPPPDAPAAPPAELIDIDQFMKIQLRTAKVESAERIPKADKLLRLVVDLGSEKRQIVAGIAASYAPEQLVGRTIVIVANLKPAKLRGIESQGMLLAADPGDGAVVIGFDKDVAPGTRVR